MRLTSLGLILTLGIVAAPTLAFALPTNGAKPMSERALTGKAQAYTNKYLGGAREIRSQRSRYRIPISIEPTRDITALTKSGAIHVLTFDRATGTLVKGGDSGDLLSTVLTKVKSDEGRLKNGGNVKVSIGGDGGKILTREGLVRVTVSSGRGTQGRLIGPKGEAPIADPADGKPTNRVPGFTWSE
jgi:hypothetical protein